MKRVTSWIGDETPSTDDFDTLFDVAVVIPTILRESLLNAVRSVYAQDIAGRIQLLIGVDDPGDAPEVLDTLRNECPSNVSLCILDMGYSSAVKNGGLYSCNYGGALRTILSYMAHSEYVAYLDDDNWMAPDHLSTLRAAVENHDWAFSHRVFVNPQTHQPICTDEWESIGPGKGVFAERFGGFSDPNTLMLNKMKCHMVLPAWSMTPTEGGNGSDRIVFHILKTDFKWQGTGKATAYYTLSEADDMHDLRLKMFQSKGIAVKTNDAGQTIYDRD